MFEPAAHVVWPQMAAEALRCSTALGARHGWRIGGHWKTEANCASHGVLLVDMSAAAAKESESSSGDRLVSEPKLTWAARAVWTTPTRTASTRVAYEAVGCVGASPRLMSPLGCVAARARWAGFFIWMQCLQSLLSSTGLFQSE